MGIIPHFRESGAPRIIGATAGAQIDTEAHFLEFAAVPANIVSAGALVLVQYPDSVKLYRRTRVEIPADEGTEPTGPYFKLYREVVSPTNSVNLGSIVSVGAFFDVNTGVPESPWIRVVGITAFGQDGPVFGLVEMP